MSQQKAVDACVETAREAAERHLVSAPTWDHHEELEEEVHNEVFAFLLEQHSELEAEVISTAIYDGVHEAVISSEID